LPTLTRRLDDQIPTPMRPLDHRSRRLPFGVSRPSQHHRPPRRDLRLDGIEPPQTAAGPGREAPSCRRQRASLACTQSNRRSVLSRHARPRRSQRRFYRWCCRGPSYIDGHSPGRGRSLAVNLPRGPDVSCTARVSPLPGRAASAVVWPDPPHLACRTESSSCAVSELLNADERGQVVALEHCCLKRRTPCAEGLDKGVRLRLHNKMDMCWAMRPETDIHLRGFRQTPHYATRALKKRSHLGRFVRIQIRHPYHVARRLDQESPNSQRSDAVFNAPVFGLPDRTTWESTAPVSKVACDAAAYVHTSRG
jgi:hypothetical protein